MSSDISRRRESAAKEASEGYRDRRDALMSAAVEVFREQGFDGAALNDIAERAGLDRASLYYYIDSKEGLYRSIVEGVVRNNVARVEGIRAGSGTGAEKLSEVVRLLMESYAVDYPHLYVFVAEDFGRRGPRTRQGRRTKKSEQSESWRRALNDLGDAYHRCVRDIVAKGYEDGTLSSDLTPGVVAHGVIGMVSWTHRWFRPDGATSAQQVADGYLAMVLSGLSPRE